MMRGGLMLALAGCALAGCRENPQPPATDANVMENAAAVQPLATPAGNGAQLRAAARLVPARDGYDYSPHRLIPLADGRTALIGSIEKPDAAHVETGFLSIHYLAATGGARRIAGAWPEAVAGNGFGGGPSEWRVDERFTDNPTVMAEAGYMAQGVLCGWTTLTELTPAGPVTSDIIRTSYDDSGFQEGRGAVTILNGVIANIRKDESFDVRYSGSRRFTDHYVRQGGKWVVRGESGLQECG